MPHDTCEGQCKGWHGGGCSGYGIGGSGGVEVAVMGVGGGDSDIAVDIVLQRFKMKGEKKKENLPSWHQTQWEGDGNCSMKE